MGREPSRSTAGKLMEPGGCLLPRERDPCLLWGLTPHRSPGTLRPWQGHTGGWSQHSEMCWGWMETGNSLLGGPLPAEGFQEPGTSSGDFSASTRTLGAKEPGFHNLVVFVL